MKGRVVPIAFAAGFTGVMAIAMAFPVPIAPGAERAGTDETAPAGLAPQRPAATSLATAAPGTFTVEPVAPFGRLMPDGYYCGVGCPDEDHP